jgi:hypothetical protein
MSKKGDSKIQCLYCEDIIQSMYTHDFKFCKCGETFVDGGDSYLRYGARDLKMVKVLEEDE